MADWLTLLQAEGYELSPGADSRAIDAAGAAVRLWFPSELRSLYPTSDGVFDASGQWWVIWPLEMLAEENEQRRHAGLLPGSLLAFGDDGTGAAFCVEPGYPGVICWHSADGWKEHLAPDLFAFWQGWTRGAITT